MPETGHVKGVLRGHKIAFTKFMPVATYMTGKGTSARSDEPHPPIHYIGDFDAETISLSGKWHIESGYFDGYEFPVTTGTWEAQPTSAAK
ncbi:MAG: hypothetical protein AB8B55_09425 [Mariniblastus sp.]